MNSSPGRDAYAATIAEFANWCDTAQLRGALVYTDNSLADPWLVSQVGIGASQNFIPMVAVQPAYHHPFTVARAVASIAAIHHRAVDLNFVSGGFSRDLASLGDELDHDLRYARLIEFANVVKSLLTGGKVTYEGEFFRLSSAQIDNAPQSHLQPRVFISGSSVAAGRAALQIGATQLSYPPPPEEIAAMSNLRSSPFGIRIGIIARPETECAWAVARRRFPINPEGARLQRVVSRMSGSSWQRDLSDRSESETGESAYWLHPFRTFKTFCPYLVGSYEEVGKVLRKYLKAGAQTLILDYPREFEDLTHASLAITHAINGEDAPP